MAKVKELTVCNLHKEGLCHVEKAGPKVDTKGKDKKGQLITGKVCEDLEYKYICSYYPITKL